jgi:hypothetical protein
MLYDFRRFRLCDVNSDGEFGLFWFPFERAEDSALVVAGQGTPRDPPI